MKFDKLPSLRELPKEYRVLAGLIMLVLTIGYVHALGYVYLTTRMGPRGIEQRYRGTSTTVSAAAVSSQSSEEAELQQPATSTAVNSVTGDIQYEKSLAEMLNIIHTHVITMTLIFTLSGLITLMTSSIPSAFRSFIVTEPFYGIIATFGGIWATRYIHPSFSWLVSVSGALMAFAYFCQCYAVLRELLSYRNS